MILRALLLPAALLLDPKGCSDHDTTPPTTTTAEAAQPAATPPAPVALDGGGMVALAPTVAAPVEDTPARRAFFSSVRDRWMRRLRREPEMRADVDEYMRALNRGNPPMSPPPWPTSFESGPEPNAARFVWGGCVGPEFVASEMLAGMRWHRNGIDRVCCYNTSPIRRQRLCFDTSSDSPRHVSTEDVAP